ncbi:c-type cytochrome [Mucilaginibacter litoreus]|uniref:C-type cytochrome n=1 Tax=Mucilaginibacter litoreus TaxID=1048221 RepID=A0ABW3AVE6_9SPHI
MKYWLLSFPGIAVVALSFISIQQNSAPVVKITAPKVATFSWDAPVSYSISVADKEDGDSKFDEINGLEVLLEVRFIDSKGQVPSANQPAAPDEQGLAIMRSSNCFNCHNFNSKLIGPSYSDIVAKYPLSAANVALLTKRIKEGSAGIWGKAAMPTHPELSDNETETVVKWMYKQAANPNVTYYTGLDGVFRTKAAPADKKGTYVITASYTDHGLKTTPGKQRITGRDMMILQSR